MDAAPLAPDFLQTNAWTIDVANSIAAVVALRPDYELLLRQTQNTLPFSLHEWHVTWCAHFLNHSPGIVDQPMFYRIRDASGACVAIFPLIMSRRRVGPLRIYSVTSLGADPAITEIRTPLIAPGHERMAVEKVRNHLYATQEWDWIQWTGVTADMFAESEHFGSLKWQTPL